MDILTEENLLAVIDAEVLQDITEDDATVLDTAELQAIGEVAGYLNIRYDSAKCMDASMIAPNEPTHSGYSGIATVIGKLVDITLYHAHARVMPDNIPKLRVDRYNNAINWLEKVAAGYIAPILPIKETAPTTPLRHGNTIDKSNTYY